MKASAFYLITFQRQNMLRAAFLGFFFNLCSWPRLMMEVFLRRQMGERYFSLTAVLVVFALLWVIPHYWVYRGNAAPFLTWTPFMLAFLGAGLYRKWEIRRPAHVFNFERFSLSAGDTWTRLHTLTLQGKTWALSPRHVRVLAEPAVFFLPGAVLWWGLHQYLGILWMGCAVVYSLSYVAAYRQGTELLLDRIDQLLCEQDMGETLREGRAADFSRGVECSIDLPTDPAQRRQVAPLFLNDEPAYPVR